MAWQPGTQLPNWRRRLGGRLRWLPRWCAALLGLGSALGGSAQPDAPADAAPIVRVQQIRARLQAMDAALQAEQPAASPAGRPEGTPEGMPPDAPVAQWYNWPNWANWANWNNWNNWNNWLKWGKY